MKMKLKSSIDNALQARGLAFSCSASSCAQPEQVGCGLQMGLLRMLGLGRITIPGGTPGAGQALGESWGSCSEEPS